MSTAKDQIKQILEDQTDDSSYDEILKELAFKGMVEKGLDDMSKGNIVSNEEMKNKIKSWQK
jgi:predicted transcriptional regulator